MVVKAKSFYQKKKSTVKNLPVTNSLEIADQTSLPTTSIAVSSANCTLPVHKKRIMKSKNSANVTSRAKNKRITQSTNAVVLECTTKQTDGTGTVDSQSMTD